MSENQSGHSRQYRGELTAVQAANAIRAARLNALDLYDTAEMLFNLKRFQHSLAFSILAIEESAKLLFLLLLFIGPDAERQRHWRDYRLHRAKTNLLNESLCARIRAEFPEIPLATAKAIGQMGPTPDDLEMLRQRAIYSDCYVVDSELICHQPGLAEFRHVAWERLCEAKALVFAARDRTPPELEIWKRHARAAQDRGLDFASAIGPLHEELSEKGLITKGSWDSILADIAAELDVPKEAASSAESN